MFNPKQKFELSPRLKLGVGRGYSKNQIFKFSAYFCLVLTAILVINTARLIAKNHSVTSANYSPQVLGATDVKTQEEDSIEFAEYTVQKGDTLFEIAQRYNISWTALATLNNLKNFNIKPGQILKVPKQ